MALRRAVLGPIIFGLVLYTVREKYDSAYCCEWTANGLHPVLMVFAFAWLGPWGALSYKTCEQMLRMPHWEAKAVHAGLQSSALLVGLVGLVSKVKGVGEGTHFRSMHSWVGLATVIVYALQFVLGAAAFGLPLFGLGTKQRLLPVHGFLGLTSLVLSLGSIVLGILSSVKFGPYESGVADDAKPLAEEQWTLLNAAGLLTVLLGLAVCGVFAADGASRRGLAPEQVSLLNDGDKKTQDKLIEG